MLTYLHRIALLSRLRCFCFFATSALLLLPKNRKKNQKKFKKKTITKKCFCFCYCVNFLFLLCFCLCSCLCSRFPFATAFLLLRLLFIATAFATVFCSCISFNSGWMMRISHEDGNLLMGWNYLRAAYGALVSASFVGVWGFYSGLRLGRLGCLGSVGKYIDLSHFLTSTFLTYITGLLERGSVFLANYGGFFIEIIVWGLYASAEKWWFVW